MMLMRQCFSTCDRLAQSAYHAPGALAAMEGLSEVLLPLTVSGHNPGLENIGSHCTFPVPPEAT